MGCPCVNGITSESRGNAMFLVLRAMASPELSCQFNIESTDFCSEFARNSQYRYAIGCSIFVDSGEEFAVKGEPARSSFSASAR
jgi:hypothetical protein